VTLLFESPARCSRCGRSPETASFAFDQLAEQIAALALGYGKTQSRLAAGPGSEEPAIWRCCANSIAEGVCPLRGFVQAPTFWRSFQPHQIQPFTGRTCTKTCTFSVPFRRKPRPNGPVHGEPVFARANPQAGRRWPVSPPKYRPESLPQKSRLFWPLGPRTEEIPPTPKNAREGRFRPKKRHSTRNVLKH
jgi:hypothetical protein